MSFNKNSYTKRSKRSIDQVRTGMDVAFSTASCPAESVKTARMVPKHQSTSAGDCCTSEKVKQVIRQSKHKHQPCVYVTRVGETVRVEDFGSLSKTDRNRCKTARGWYISSETLKQFLMPLLILLMITGTLAKTDDDNTFYEQYSEHWLNTVFYYMSYPINIFVYGWYLLKKMWILKWMSFFILTMVVLASYVIFRTINWYTRRELPTTTKQARFKIRCTKDQFEEGLLHYITLATNGETRDEETTNKYIEYDTKTSILKKYDEEIQRVLRRDNNTRRGKFSVEDEVKQVVKNIRVCSNAKNNRLFGYFNLGEWMEYYRIYKDQVNRNCIIHNKKDDKFEWNEEIYDILLRIEEVKNQLSKEKLKENKHILDELLTELTGKAEDWEIFNSNKLLLVETTCKYKINLSHEIFAIPMYVASKETTQEAQQFLNNVIIAVELLLSMTEFGDVRTEKSGNVELTVMEEMKIKGTLLNKVNQTRYKKTIKAWYPLKLNDVVQTKVYKNGKADVNLINAVINQEAGLNVTSAERNLLYTQLNSYMLSMAIESKAAYDYTVETCNELKERIEVNDGPKRLCRKIKRLLYTTYKTATWGELVHYTSLIIKAASITTILSAVLYMIGKPDDLPSWYLIPAVEYLDGPMCKWPEHRRSHIVYGNASNVNVKPQYKMSRAIMSEEKTDMYNTTSVDNLKCAIEARCLADNRTRTFTLDKMLYNLDRKYWNFYMVDKDNMQFSTVGRALKGDFGRYMAEKADEIADTIIADVGPEQMHEIEIETFKKFLQSKAYSQKQIKKMLSEVPEILADNKDFLSVNHTWGAFVKQEEYETQSRPRGIQGASSVTKMIGPAMEVVQHSYFSRRQCIKTVPIADRPYVLDDRYKGQGYLYQTDHSSFEGAQMDDVRMLTEFRVFKRCYPRLWNLMNAIWRQNRSEDDHNVKETIKIGRPGNMEHWIIDSIRMSGSPDTSFGNTIVNECVTHALLKSQGVSDYIATFEGDDALIMTKSKLDIDKIFDDSIEAGFKLKLDVREHVYDAGFLSMFWDPETKVIRSGDLSKTLYGVFTHYSNKLYELGEDAYLKSKMLSALIQNPGNKMMYYLFEKVQDLCKGLMMLPNDYWTKFKLDSMKIKWYLDEQRNKIIVKFNGMLDVQKFIRKDQWDIPDDINHDYWVEQISKITNKNQLYQLVADFMNLTKPMKTGIIDKIGYWSQQVGGSVVRSLKENKMIQKIGGDDIAAGNNVK